METYQAAALEALGDASRRLVFECVADGPTSVAAIAERVPISRPAVSQHLKVLKEARLVAVQAHGTRRIYSLDPDGLAEIREYFDRFWNTALHAYAQAVDHPTQEAQ